MPKPRGRDPNPVPTWQIIGAALAGFFLVLLLLAVAVFKENIAGPNFKIIWAILSIACASFAAIVPGFLEVRYKKLLQASGAIAVFALIYFNQPNTNAIDSPTDPPPKGVAADVAASWLQIMDEGNYS